MERMTVKELIEKLKEYNGDLEVVVQYRDGGGDYPGYDEKLYLSTRDSIKKKYLKEGQKVYREYKTVYGTEMAVVDVDRLYL